jgi:hypothetical protein
MSGIALAERFMYEAKGEEFGRTANAQPGTIVQAILPYELDRREVVSAKPTLSEPPYRPSDFSWCAEQRSATPQLSVDPLM